MTNVLNLLHDRKMQREILAGFTVRELFRDYRQSVAHLNDVTVAYNKGWDWYMGDPMRRVLANAKHDLKAVEEELANRGLDASKINNVATRVPQLTQTEIEERAKQAEIISANNRAAEEANKLKPYTDAMNAVMSFAFNYDHGFIAKANLHPAEHLQTKFSNIYAAVGPKAVMLMFWSELDAENRDALMRYILAKKI